MDGADKNERIREACSETRSRRKSMLPRVVVLKVQDNKLTSAQREALRMMFIEAKWLYNHVLALSEGEDGADVFSLKYNDIPEVLHYDKDRNPIVSPITRLSSQMRQAVLDGVCTNIANLAKAKAKGYEVGALKFISEYTSINLKQRGVSYSIAGKRRVKVQGIRKPLPVNGMEQFGRFREYETANARLIQKPSGYYIAVTVYIPGGDRVNDAEDSRPLVGIDMGCRTTFTLSDGRKFDYRFEESEQVKRLQRRLQRMTKGSKNWWKTRRKLRKAYERDGNRKEDAARKFCAALREYRTVIQNEQLSGWKENGHGDKVQHSIMGRVKTRLAEAGAAVLSEWIPTTKFCRECGHRVEVPLSSKEFRCPYCGTREDRDVHAAMNMVWFYENIVGVERTEYQPVEFRRALEARFGFALPDLGQEQQEATGSSAPW